MQDMIETIAIDLHTLTPLVAVRPLVSSIVPVRSRNVGIAAATASLITHLAQRRQWAAAVAPPTGHVTA
jgi:hypothetical protein